MTVATEFPDARMQRFASFGARAIWQLRSGQLDGPYHIEAGAFQSAEDMQALPSKHVIGGHPVPLAANGRRRACCWSNLISGYSVFAEFHPMFDSWEDAERWLLGDNAVESCDLSGHGRLCQAAALQP